jgi:hypothetical protein
LLSSTQIRSGRPAQISTWLGWLKLKNVSA